MIAEPQKATREQTKLHNKRLILKIVYNRKLVSRATVARLTHLTATTVSSVVSDLIAEGLVEEVGSVSTKRGKPPTIIQLVKDARYVIALELSHNAFRAGILNLRGEVHYEQEIPNQNLAEEAALQAIYTLIDALLAHGPGPILGIGIGTPGIVDIPNGIVNRSVLLGWRDLPLRNLLKQRYNLAAHVVNDTQAALLAEHHFGKFGSQEHLVVIRVGHGVGAGLLLNGKLLHSHGVGEIGHVTVVQNGELCSCGNRGCLETVASNRAIVKQAQVIAATVPESKLSRFASTPDAITIDVVIQSFANGDTTLLPIVETVGHYLGIAIANLIGIVGVTKILLAGRVAQFGQPLYDILERELCQGSLTARLNPIVIEQVSVRPTISDIVLLGSTTALIAEELGIF